MALDIGPGRGALVLYPDERFRGDEIEISRRDGDATEISRRDGEAIAISNRGGDATAIGNRGGDAPRTHTGVHERSTQAGSLLTAIFGSLPTGDYVVWENETTAAATVTVREGEVSELSLP